MKAISFVRESCFGHKVLRKSERNVELSFPFLLPLFYYFFKTTTTTTYLYLENIGFYYTEPRSESQGKVIYFLMQVVTLFSIAGKRAFSQVYPPMVVYLTEYRSVRAQATFLSAIIIAKE